MAKLGTTEEAARLRAKMQSSSLMSDMQAFKVGVRMWVCEHRSDCVCVCVCWFVIGG